MRPYIGVTGLMTRNEADAVVRLYQDAWREVGCRLSRSMPHDLMLGVLCTSEALEPAATKTLTDANSPLRYREHVNIARIFPDPGVIPEDWDKFERVNLLHVAPSSADELVRAMEAGGPRCTGIQVDVTWTEWLPQDDLLRFRLAYPDARVVLQVRFPPSDEANKWERRSWTLREHWALGRSPCALVEQLRLAVQMKLVTDVLVVNAGTKAPMIASALHLAFPDLGIGIAGGLCAESLPDIKPLLRIQPGSSMSAGFCVSIDAQSRLRDDAPGGGNLDLKKVEAYLRAAVRMVIV